MCAQECCELKGEQIYRRDIINHVCKGHQKNANFLFSLVEVEKWITYSLGPKEKIMCKLSSTRKAKEKRKDISIWRHSSKE